MRTGLFSLAVLLTTCFCTAIGCSSTPKSSDLDQGSLAATDEQIFVGEDIGMNYDPNVIMKRAESFYEKEGFPEAIIEYKHFLDVHRNHILAPYGQYKLAMSHFKMIKTVDRDPEPINKALKAFQQLLDEFPANRYESDAYEKIQECHDSLAKHHLFVGEFYYRKQEYLAAARRFEIIIDTYPGLDTTADAMYQLALTYKELGATDWAKDWLVTLVREYPNHQFDKEERTLLAEFSVKKPILLASRNPVGMNDSPLPYGSYANGFHPQNNPTLQPIPTKVGTPFTLQPKLNGHHVNDYNYVTLNGEASMTACSVGMWCDENPQSAGESVSSQPASPSPDSNSSVCQPGTWC